MATSQITDLFARIRDIQVKAADSEVLVQEICKDIRKVSTGRKKWFVAMWAASGICYAARGASAANRCRPP